MSASIAFYAPLKSPNHHIPSGDREIARLMMRALRLADYDVALISEVISYQKRPSAELYDSRRASVREEEDRLTDLWHAHPDKRPDLWFTYHPYCKSPDWLGPPLCARFDIPYVTAEACRTHQGMDSDWVDGRAAVQAAIKFAATNFVLKDTDWAYLQQVLPTMDTANRIAPFLDVSDQPGRPENHNPERRTGSGPILFAAGMMRPGAKAQSYQLLAEALNGLASSDWNLVVAGDGPERPGIESSLNFLPPGRVSFLGSVEHDDMFALMDQSYLFVWPGIGEAIGQVYLEAQSRGLPVVAMKTAGVPLVVSNMVGGILTPDKDVGAFRDAIKRLLEDRYLRNSLSAGGAADIRKNHDVTAVSATFQTVLDQILLGSAVKPD